MHPQAPTPYPATQEEFSTEPLAATARKASAKDEVSIDARSEAVVEVELNFNAFADHVPPTQHAKRVATHFDPSIQDFADQALEVAALRAELRRLSRDCDALRNTIHLRDSLVQTLREQLSLLRAPALADPRAEESQSYDGSATVVLETSPSGDCAATITDMPQMIRNPGALESAPGRKLLPEGHEGQEIALNRNVITIGRTQQSDICIPSRAVSRDHARLLVGSSSVTLIDMGGANGCFVNDVQIKRHKLRDGDFVRIGDRSYRFADHVHGTRTFTGTRAGS